MRGKRGVADETGSGGLQGEEREGRGEGRGKGEGERGGAPFDSWSVFYGAEDLVLHP